MYLGHFNINSPRSRNTSGRNFLDSFLFVLESFPKVASISFFLSDFMVVHIAIFFLISVGRDKFLKRLDFIKTYLDF